METVRLRPDGATRRLLIAFAHPDDESFGPAGTLARYASEGADLHYVCGTRGEAGEVAPERLAGGTSIAELRTAELRCAAEALGLNALHFLNYRDSGMEGSADNRHPDALAQAPTEAVAGAIVARIRAFRPQVVLTFDPSGGYFHPDHIKMHQAATLAFHAAGDPGAYPEQRDAGLRPHAPDRLYYAVFPRRLVRLFVRVLPLFGRDPSRLGTNEDVDLRRVARVEQRVTTRIDVRDHIGDRQRASRCHASQVEGMRSLLAPWLDRWLRRYDLYERAAPVLPEDAPLETDLFAGLAPER